MDNDLLKKFQSIRFSDLVDNGSSPVYREDLCKLWDNIERIDIVDSINSDDFCLNCCKGNNTQGECQYSFDSSVKSDDNDKSCSKTQVECSCSINGDKDNKDSDNNHNFCSNTQVECSCSINGDKSDNSTEIVKDRYSPEDISYWINFGHFRDKDKE